MRPMAPLRRSVSLAAGVGTESDRSPPIPSVGSPNRGRQVHVLLVLRIAARRSQVSQESMREPTRRITTCRGRFHGTGTWSEDHTATTRCDPKSIRLNAGALIVYTGHVGCSL